ncbi:MAG: hypothetical protein ACYC7A_18675 [Thermoanaerobaculia bacterium]
MRLLRSLFLILPLAAAGAHADEFADRMFLVEEAFAATGNATRHSLQFSDESLTYALTQEWIAGGGAHHVSCSAPFVYSRLDGPELGDVSLHYRRQLERGRASIAPRLSITLPTDRDKEAPRGHSPGIELNVPLSIIHTDRMASHWSIGLWSAAGAGTDSAIVTARGGIVWVMRPGVAAVVEAAHDTASRVSDRSTLLSPGIRVAIPLSGGTAIAPGIALPLDVADRFRSDGVIVHAMLLLPHRP